MNNKINEINFDYFDEISIGDLIFELDTSNQFSLFEIKDKNDDEIIEKNILIKIKRDDN